MKLSFYNFKAFTVAGSALALVAVFSVFCSQTERSVRSLTIEEQEILVSALDRLPENAERAELLLASNQAKVYSGFGSGRVMVSIEDGGLSVAQSFFESDPVQQEQTLLNLKERK